MTYIERIKSCKSLEDLHKLRDEIASEILQMRSAAMSEFTEAVFYKAMIEQQIKYEGSRGRFLAELQEGPVYSRT